MNEPEIPTRPRETTTPAPFQLAFWHPFGPHGGEQPEVILARKQREIEANGWTLWSFQRRSMLIDWMREVRRVGPDTVSVFCSRDTGASDPPHAPISCHSYRFVEDATWTRLPAVVNIPHPFRLHASLEASAFVVQRIVPIPWGASQIDTPVEWLSQHGVWRHETIPTRGEYLIRPGGGKQLRPYRAVLVLRDPFLAMVSSA